MRMSMSVALSLLVLVGCESPEFLVSDGGDSSLRHGTCDEPVGPSVGLVVDQGFTAPTLSVYEPLGDRPVIDGTTVVLGGLTHVQFYELDDSGVFQVTTYIAGPSGYAFGRMLDMDNGLAVISEDNYQLPGQSALTGRLRTYRKDDSDQWSLDPETPYIDAADVGLVTGSSSLGFGNSLQLQGHTMVVGSQRADGAGATPKAVFTFTNAGGWELDTVLDSAGLGPVALDGDYVAAADKNSGIIRVYKRANGVWGATPVASIPKPASASSQYANCTGCMAFDGDRLILGDIYADGTTGGAYVFERQAGGETFAQSQLLTPGGDSNTLYGFEIEASTDRVYVGSGAGGRVAIYAFSDSAGSYALTETLVGTSAEGFGRGLSVDGSRLVVGRSKAPRNEGVSAARARLYVGTEGVFGFCDDDPSILDCHVGSPVDWDDDGADDGCMGSNVFIDPSVSVPAGLQVGDNVTILANVVLGDGNTLGDGVTLGRGAALGDNNDLDDNVVVGRSAVLGSGNVVEADTVFGRDVIVGDNNVLSGRVGYRSELGSHLNLPDVVVGTRVTLGSVDSEAGDVDCVGPLVVASGADIASAPGSVFTCTGATVIGPNTTVQAAALGSGVRIRKQSFLGDSVTLADDVRVGRDVMLEGGVQVEANSSVGAAAHLCSTDEPFSGRIVRGFTDPACL